MNIQDWFPLGWTGWIALLSMGFSRVFSTTTAQKHQLFGAQLSLWSNLHIYNDHWKNHSRWTGRWPNVMITFLCPPAPGSSCRTKLMGRRGPSRHPEDTQGSSAEPGGGGPDSGLLDIWHSFPIKPTYARFLTACEWKMQLEFEERPQ